MLAAEASIPGFKVILTRSVKHRSGGDWFYSRLLVA